MKQLEIGIITKPQGLKGELRIKLYSNNFELLNSVNYLLINNQKFELVNKTNRNTFAVIKLKSIDNINETEMLINKKAYVYEEDIVLEEDEFLVSQLTNFTVIFNTGEVLGTLINVNNFGASDIYSVEMTNGEEVLFANVRDVVLSINTEERIITLNKEIFNQVCVKN